MNKTAYIAIRVEPDVKDKALKVLYEVGLTPSQVFTLVLKQVVRNKRFLCDLLAPNQETNKAMEEIEKGKISSTNNTLYIM